MGAFPDVPLTLSAQAAFGADLTADPSTWVWTDLTCEHPSLPGQIISRLMDTPITIRKRAQIGTASGATGGETSTANGLQLLNHDGALTPGNPTSPYYPYLDEGVPVRLYVNDRAGPLLTDTFTRTTATGWGTATSGTTWSTATPTSVAVNGSAATITLTAYNVNRTLVADGIVTRDCDVLFDTSWPSLPTGVTNATFRTGVNMRAADASNCLRPVVVIQTDAAVGVWVTHRVAGVASTIAAVLVPGLTYTPGMVLRCRFQVQDTTIRLKAWPASGAEPAGWHLDNVDTPIRTAGQVHLVAHTGSGNTNTLPLTMTVDNVTVTPLPTARAHMYITDIQPTFEPGAGGVTWSTVHLSLGGVGTRIEKRQAQAWSPMRRSVQLAAIPPYAYWPLEDAQGSTAGASAFPEGPKMVVAGPAVFAFDAGTPADEYLTRYGTKPMVSVAAGVRLSAIVPTAPVNSEWAVSFVAQCFAPGIPVTELRIAQWETPGGTFERWALVSRSTGYSLRGYSRSSGATVATDLIADAVGGAYGEQVTWTIEVQQSGANIGVELFANDNSLGSATVAGTVTPLNRITLNPDAVNTTASVDPYGIKFIVGHVRVVQETFTIDTPRYTVPETDQSVNALRAWTQEPAHRRALRLCAEERVPIVVDGTPGLAGSTLLGAQRDDTFLPLLTAAVDAESGGLLHEEWFGYRMVPRAARYNRPVALTVDLTSYRRSADTEQGQVLVPQLASRAANYWTITRTGGSSGTWAAPQAVRDLRGTVADERTLDLLTDDVLTDHARWRTHVTSDDTGPSYPGLPVDLAANPDLIEEFKGLLIGDRAQRVGVPTIAGYGPVDQVVEGITETLSPTRWSADLEVAPAAVWDVAVYDSSATRRDSSSSTLGVDRSATQPSWTFTTANQAEVWDTTAVPYSVRCAGEDVMVTAMGAPVGSGPWTQTATVTRSVNGVIKEQRAGTPIHLTVPAFRAL